MPTECEIATFYHYSMPIARKSYECCECQASIDKGVKHFHGRGKWSYGVKSYRQHIACMEACMLIRDELNGGDCIGFGTLQEEFAEMRSQDDRIGPWVQLRSLMAQILWRERKA